MPNRVYVGGIGEEIRERDLEKFFKHFKLAGISLKQGYGFVDFDDPRDADDACYELNGKKCCDSRWDWFLDLIILNKVARIDVYYGKI